MKKLTATTAWLLVPGLVVLSLLLVQPLIAEETAPQKGQEVSFFQSINQTVRGWFGEDESSRAAPKKIQKKAEPQPAPKDSQARKDYKKVQKRMQKMSDNISKSVDRDKKTVKKKLNKWFGDDKAKEKK